MKTPLHIQWSLLVMLLLASCFGYAQNEQGKTDVSIGIGGSFIGFYFLNEDYGPDVEAETSRVLNLSLDHCFSPHFSFGIAASRQRFGLNYNDYEWYDERINAFETSSFSESLTRTNIAFRGLLHYGFMGLNPKVDPYIGLRTGYSIWRYEENSPDPEWVQLDLDRQWLSFQGIMGIKLYFTDQVGMNLEAALGTPYLFAAGINYKFGNTKMQSN